MPTTAKAPRTLQVRMAERGLFKLRDLSLKTGIREGQLGKFARGHVPTETEPLCVVAKALGCTASDVLASIVESGRFAAEQIEAAL